jgi:hypothetical protein
MKPQAILACAASVTVLSFFGCSSEEPPKPPPDFEAGATQTRAQPASYPAGPYGVGKGSIIPNFKFIGYANAVEKNDGMQVIALGDFYNPHGRDANYKPASAAEDDRLYPPGSQYGEGKPKPTVLAIDVASVWCGPCNAEAACVLPVHQERYGACGGGLFLQLQDGNTPGIAATPKNLYTWTVKQYKEDFPTAIDPAGRLGALFAADAFPQNFIIDMTTMEIVEVLAGVPDEAYWKTYESLLVDPECPSKQPTCTTNSDCPQGKYCSTSCPANAALCIPNSCQRSGCLQ